MFYNSGSKSLIVEQLFVYENFPLKFPLKYQATANYKCFLIKNKEGFVQKHINYVAN